MPPFDVSPAAPHELLPACRLLFSDGRAEYSRDRILSEADTSRLFVARGGGKLRAAALVQALPGALGVAWVPRGDSPAALDAVMVAAVAWLRERGVKVCQAFAAESEVADMAPLERAGFAHTTQLLFLRRNRGGGFDPKQRLTFVADGAPLSGAFAATLLATHDGTLDCPELNGPRTPAEILAGFESSAASEPYTARRGDAAVGVVVLEYPGRDAAELTYLGVVPGERGKGLGAELLGFALAAASGRPVLNVAVDARNTPAVCLYERHGFAEYDRRAVWLWTRAR